MRGGSCERIDRRREEKLRKRDRKRSRERRHASKRSRRSRRSPNASSTPRRRTSRRSNRSASFSSERLKANSDLSRSRSIASNSDFAKLTDVLAGIVQQSSKKSSNHFINEKFLPKFDPSDKNQSAADWIDRVNSCAILYDWDDKTKLYLAVCRLRGNAKVWYNELHESHLSWPVFSHTIIRQFPR